MMVQVKKENHHLPKDLMKMKDNKEINNKNKIKVNQIKIE